MKQYTGKSYITIHLCHISGRLMILSKTQYNGIPKKLSELDYLESFRI